MNDKNITTDDKEIPSSNILYKTVHQINFAIKGSAYKVDFFPKNITLEKNEVCIRVKACGISFQDVMFRQSLLESNTKLPVVPGFECAGIIESVGSEVTNLKTGDRVVAVTNFNAWCEVVVISSSFAFKLPDEISFYDGVALCMSYLLAYILLFNIGNLSSGMCVFAHSLGGSVGIAICQLCQLVDDVTLVGTASVEKHEKLKDYAYHVCTPTSDYLSEIKRIVPEGINLYLDSQYGESCSKGFSMLRPLGMYILYGMSCLVTGETKNFFNMAKSWWCVDKLSPQKCFDENFGVTGCNLRRLLFDQKSTTLIANVLSKLFSLCIKGKIKPIVDSVWGFDQANEAVDKLLKRQNFGKVILEPIRNKVSSIKIIEAEVADRPANNNEEGEGERNEEMRSE